MCRFAARLRRWLAWGLCCLALAGQAQTVPAEPAGPAGPAAPPAPRAIWMWEEDSWTLLREPARVQEMARFLHSQGIGTLYLYADAHAGQNLLLEQPQRYARLIGTLHRQGLQVHALLGSWPLHTERYILPENRGLALQMVQRVLDYNLAAAPEARFDGIHLDIEPHVLDDWAQRREAYLQMFLDLSEAWMALKRQSNLHLPMAPAIAFWLDGIPVRHAGRVKPASEHLQDIYDHVVLMDYRDHAHGPDGILSHAEDELAYGRRVGKPVWLGVETSPSEIRKLSFEHLRPAQMAHELGLVEQALAADPAFAGFVIHHYGSYRRWLGR